MPLADKISSSALSKAEAWLSEQESHSGLPFYLSTDVRDSGFKAFPVDANLFPAGFNNLHTDDHAFAADAVLVALQQRCENPRRVLLIAEEHSRNLWYLENIAVLKSLIERHGIEVALTTPSDLAEVEYVNGIATLKSHSGIELSFVQISWAAAQNYDIAILNNDLINGIPDSINDLPFSICPPPKLGWHSRSKSTHFAFYNDIAAELAKILEIDPWHLTALGTRVADVDINIDSDREIMAGTAQLLLDQIAAKYREHKIDEKPFAFLKADYGTYGMGVMPFESAEQIATMNRKTRNRLFKGKGSREIHAYLLMEGIPGVLKHNGYSAEVSVYQIDASPVGQFLRYNTEKSGRENLNSTGMGFYPFSTANPVIDANSLRLYYILTRASMLAVSQEAGAAQVKGCGDHELSFSH